MKEFQSLEITVRLHLEIFGLWFLDKRTSTDGGGCEINFEPDLDECWEVKNVKRGARPIEELRNKLRELLVSPIRELRKEVQNYWKRGVPSDISQHIRQTASTLMERNSSVTVPEVQSQLQGCNNFR